MDAVPGPADPVVMHAQRPEETHALIAAAFNAGDLDALVETYEEGATLIVPPGGERVSGKDEIRSALAATFALEPTAAMEVVATLEADGLALTFGRWHLAGTDADGNRVELSGRGTIVSRRQPDGRWLIALDNPIADRDFDRVAPPG